MIGGQKRLLRDILFLKIMIFFFRLVGGWRRERWQLLRSLVAPLVNSRRWSQIQCIAFPLKGRWELILRQILSSPRAESARAVTGRRCPHSGKGEDFLTGQPDFFTETAEIPERKVEKSIPRWENNRHAKG